MNKREFEIVVQKALDGLPEEFSKNLENIEITIEDKPKFSRAKNFILLGLYQGIPLGKRGHYYAGVLPDKITLYQKNIETICKDEQEMITQIRLTLLHEIGHYFGISERKLRELGY